MANKTTLTPAEFDGLVQNLQRWDSLHVHEKTAPSATDILKGRVIREKLSVEEIVVRIANPGDPGDDPTEIDVKKNGTSILTAVISVDEEAAANTVAVAVPATDAKAAFDVGDVITVETGTVAANLVDLTVEVRMAKILPT